MGVQGGLGVLNPPGRSQGDVLSLLIIDRGRDKLQDFNSLQLCCDLLEEGWLWAGLEGCSCSHVASAAWSFFLLSKQNSGGRQAG